MKACVHTKTYMNEPGICWWLTTVILATWETEIRRFQAKQGKKFTRFHPSQPKRHAPVPPVTTGCLK
jgi:hypothetical protein